MATKPQNYLTLLFPGFQLLDQAGPIDILSVLTKRAEGANITLTYIAETSEPVGAAIKAPKNASWKFGQVPAVPADPRDSSIPAGTRFNPRVAVDITFSEALESLKSTGKIPVGESGELGELDVLLIPGGIGTRIDRIDVESGANLGSNIASCIDFVKQAAPYIKHTILTVCTGSSLLAQTGLLDGRRACTNFMAFDGVKAKSPSVNWLEKRRWVRSLPDVDGVDAAKGGVEKEIWTSAGISAGMDLMLWYVAAIYGKDVARETGRRLEYEWRESVGEGEVDPYYS